MSGGAKAGNAGRAPSAATAGFQPAYGASIGVAVGFACFALLVPLGGVSYYVGAPDEPGAFAAAARAGWLWFACTAAGVLWGVLVAWLAGAGERTRSWLARGGVVFLAAYLLCLRGAWGRVARELALAPAGPARAPAAPAAAWSAPLLAVVVAGAALWIATRGSRPGAARAPALTLAGVHLLCSLTAAITTVQLAYYVSRTPAFLRGLGRLAAFLAGR